ncbi:hypothetical protein RND81_08G041300 [Saponaria officinalis]|uniref:RING-type domain-containing protein n=1 Tax=Saponaria officinalis TaxID=3572 RepID=A0AAW1J3S2_SAPOF
MPRNNRRDQNVNIENNPNRRNSPETTQQPPSSTKPNPKFLSILLQALIMTFIISLFFIFVGVAAIIFIHLCVVGGALHRRRIRRRPISGDVESLSGFSLDSIKALPMSRIKGAEVCAICLEDVEKGEFFRVLPNCKHVFHLNCVDKWLVKVPACPTCRRTVGFDGFDHHEVDRTAVFDWERLWLSCG